MSLTKKLKTETGKALSSQDEIKYRRKYKELKRRIRDIEADNNHLTERLQRAKKNLQRLRVERNFLFEKIENFQNDNGVGSTDSEIMSASDSEDGIEMSDLDDTPHAKYHRRARKGSKSLIKTRKLKDPNAPKRPGNVFFLYCRMERDKVKQEFPEEQLGDLTKLLGLRWKGLTKDEKQKYYDAYKKENEDYEIKMKDYTPKLPASNPPSASKGIRKRPRSPDATATAASQNMPAQHPQLASVRGDSAGGGGGSTGSELGSEDVEQDDDMEDVDEDGYDDLEDGEGVNGDVDGVDGVDGMDGADGADVADVDEDGAAGGQRREGNRGGSLETESEGSQDRAPVT